MALLPAGQWVLRTNLPSDADFQFADFTDIDLFGLRISQILGNLLITCRILSFFLVVSKKMCNFASIVKRLIIGG